MAKHTRSMSLDILRGVAVLLVVFHHVDTVSVPALPQLSGVSGFVFWKIKQLGWSGVDLFFILSGFLIGGLLLSEAEKYKSIDVARFLLRRGCKIWPSYLVLLAVLAVCDSTGWVRGDSLVESAQSVLIHVLYLQNYLDVGVNGPTWSLAIEEHFYTFLALLIAGLCFFSVFTSTAKPLLPCVLLLFIIAVVLLRIEHVFSVEFLRNDFMQTHFRLDSLLMGVLLQCIYRHHQQALRRFTQRYYYWIVLVACLMIAPSMFYSRNHVLMFSIGFTLLYCGYALLVLLVVCHGFGQFENSRVANGIAGVGRSSYNIYLWHVFFPLLLAPVYQPLQVSLAGLPVVDEIIVSLQVLVYGSLSIVVGYIMTRVVEAPFLALRADYLPARHEVRGS